MSYMMQQEIQKALALAEQNLRQAKRIGMLTPQEYAEALKGVGAVLGLYSAPAEILGALESLNMSGQAMYDAWVAQQITTRNWDHTAAMPAV